MLPADATTVGRTGPIGAPESANSVHVCELRVLSYLVNPETPAIRNEASRKPMIR
jgi:hypothetical protein